MRGQVSLDFILTIVVALVVLGSIAAVGSTIIETQKSSTIRQQLDSIGNTLAAIISTSSALSDGAAGTSISYTIPKIAVPGEEKLQPCDVSIDRGNGIITLGYAAEPVVSVLKKFVNPAGITNVPGTAKCGELITISK